MLTIDQVFHAFGGPTNLGQAINVSPQTASNMKARGSIAPRHWPALVAAAKRRAAKRDVTIEQVELLRSITIEALAHLGARAA